jgi:uncharacterized protein YpiB (UPF0302 family)
MDEALKEIWRAKFQKARDREFQGSPTDLEKEIELLKMKIDMCLDTGNEEEFEKLSKQLKSIEFFIYLKNCS